MQQCSNCQYYIGGLCKWNPPPQPTVEANDWCSHWCPMPYPDSPAEEAMERE